MSNKILKNCKLPAVERYPWRSDLWVSHYYALINKIIMPILPFKIQLKSRFNPEFAMYFKSQWMVSC